MGSQPFEVRAPFQTIVWNYAPPPHYYKINVCIVFIRKLYFNVDYWINKNTIQLIFLILNEFICIIKKKINHCGDQHIGKARRRKRQRFHFSSFIFQHFKLHLKCCHVSLGECAPSLRTTGLNHTIIVTNLSKTYFKIRT
jgi:hypothetical protein